MRFIDSWKLFNLVMSLGHSIWQKPCSYNRRCMQLTLSTFHPCIYSLTTPMELFWRRNPGSVAPSRLHAPVQREAFWFLFDLCAVSLSFIIISTPTFTYPHLPAQTGLHLEFTSPSVSPIVENLSGSFKWCAACSKWTFILIFFYKIAYITFVLLWYREKLFDWNRLDIWKFFFMA